MIGQCIFCGYTFGGIHDGQCPITHLQRIERSIGVLTQRVEALTNGQTPNDTIPERFDTERGFVPEHIGVHDELGFSAGCLACYQRRPYPDPEAAEPRRSASAGAELARKGPSGA